MPYLCGRFTATKHSAIYEQLHFNRRGFRLLTFELGKGREVTVYDYEVWRSEDMADCHQYEALLYAWASRPGSTAKVLHGKETAVTKIFACVLHSLPFEDGHRVLWVDALCMSQDDLQERNHQFRQMRFNL